jgi:hypothetical protein
MGLVVSRTILTAPARNSGSNFLLVSGIVTPETRISRVWDAIREGVQAACSRVTR